MKISFALDSADLLERFSDDVMGRQVIAGDST
jgi:hypothetical protein